MYKHMSGYLQCHICFIISYVDPTRTTIVMIFMWTCAGLGTALVLVLIVTSAVIIVQWHTIKTLKSKGKM